MHAALTLILLLPSLVLAKASTPNFQCQDKDGTRYRIWISTDYRAMEVSDTSGTKTYPLSAANIAKPPKGPGERLVYQHWNRQSKDPANWLDPSIEFSTRYGVEANQTAAQVGIVLHHREKWALKCTTSRSAVTLVPEAQSAPASERYAEQLSEMAELRTKNGMLKVSAIKGVESAILRMVYSPDFKNERSRNDFLKRATDALKKISPPSIAAITQRLTPEGKTFLTQVLTEIRYDHHPIVERARTWVVEGCRPNPLRDLESVRAGFDEFVSSTSFKEKDLKTFFMTEVSPALKALSDAEIAMITYDLSPEAKTFLSQLYGKAQGRRSLADFPDIESMKNTLALLIQDKEFDPMKVRDLLLAFNSSSLALNEESRKIYIETLRPVMKQLSPRQREDVTGWLEMPELNLFKILLQ